MDVQIPLSSCHWHKYSLYIRCIAAFWIAIADVAVDSPIGLKKHAQLYIHMFTSAFIIIPSIVCILQGCM